MYALKLFSSLSDDLRLKPQTHREEFKQVLAELNWNNLLIIIIVIIIIIITTYGSREKCSCKVSYNQSFFTRNS